MYDMWFEILWDFTDYRDYKDLSSMVWPCKWSLLGLISYNLGGSVTIPSLHLRLLRGMRCSIFYFYFLLGGYLVPLILLSDSCPFLPLVSLFLSFFWGFGHLPLFVSSYSLFSEHLPSWNNVASGSNQNISSIYFTGNNRDKIMFLASLLDRSRIFFGGSGDGNEWIYVDAYI